MRQHRDGLRSRLNEWHLGCTAVFAGENVVARQSTRRFALVVMIVIFMTGVSVAPQPAASEAGDLASIHSNRSKIDIPATLSVPTSTERPRAVEHEAITDEDEPFTDLYGNDVASAIAKYNLDADGSLYEAHSPQTQLPRLGSPKG
jgi:hypothetical protein